MKLKKEIKAYIEAELRDYYDTLHELEELKEDIAQEVPIIDDTGAKTNKISRPTEVKTMAILTNKRIRRMEQVIKAIDMVIGELPEEKVKLVELKYWQRPRRLTDAGIAMELGVSRRTVYYWAEEICNAIAVELGLINTAELKQA